MVSQLRLYEMGSGSMEPVIHGHVPSSPTSGDVVLISKLFDPQRLQKNDLVFVSFVTTNGMHVRTIRRVAGIARDSYLHPSKTNEVLQIPDGFVYLLAESTNGIDSRQLGLFRSSQIEGKVLHVFR